MKKVMIIGAGAQGNVISGVLSRAGDVAGILLGDVDVDRANEVARFVGSDKIRVKRVDELDEIDYIGIKDYGIIECDEPVAMWSVTTYLEDCTNEGVYWEGGQYKYAPSFSGEEEYYFPPPLDHRGKVYYHCHEEPVTIPKFIGKPVKSWDVKIHTTVTSEI